MKLPVRRLFRSNAITDCPHGSWTNCELRSRRPRGERLVRLAPPPWDTIVMILNDNRTQAVSSLGWVDRGSLWVYSVSEASSQKMTLSDATYLSVSAGAEDFFSVAHHWNGERLEITAHNHLDPRHIISRLSLRRTIPGFPSRLELLREGDLRVWDRLPGAFTGYAFGEYQLVLTRYTGEDDVQTFAWFDDAYDKGYQGIIGAVAVPDSSYLIVSVQRDSHPVLYDPETKKAIRKLHLADRNGNPSFQFRESALEFWATDYDSIVKLDGKTLAVKNARCMQDAIRGTRQFIGNFCFNSDQDVCLIARPFSGDAVALDANSMTEISRIELGQQPLDIGALADGTVVARDWKTGDSLFGKT